MEIEVINTLDLLKKIHINIIDNAKKNEEFKNNYLYQVIELLHRKIISLVESIIVLNRNYKYAESRMLLRNVFETGIFILYLQQRPFESLRWLNWNNLSASDKDKIPNKYDDFKKYLIDNGYKQTIDIMSKDNHSSIKNFSPSFIRNMAFKNNQYLNGDDFKEFYNLVCKFSHPSFLSMAKNDILELESKIDIEKSTLFILLESSTIFIEVLKNFVDDGLSKVFDNKHKQLKNTLNNSA